MTDEELQKFVHTPKQWYVEENERSWQLFYGQRTSFLLDLQIIKAPKRDSPMAEYWPNEEQTKFIVDALNEAERRKDKR